MAALKQQTSAPTTPGPDQTRRRPSPSRTPLAGSIAVLVLTLSVAAVAAFIFAQGDERSSAGLAPAREGASAPASALAPPVAIAAAGAARVSRDAPPLAAGPAPAPARTPARAPSITGRSYAEIRAELVERSRQRAIAEGRLKEWEDRERRKAEGRERRALALEAHRAAAQARRARADLEARLIAQGGQPAPQPVPLAGAARTDSTSPQQTHAVTVPHVTGGR